MTQAEKINYTLQSYQREINIRDRRIAELEADNKRLRELLKEYGRHVEGCSASCGNQYRCKCGWDQAIADQQEGK